MFPASATSLPPSIPPPTDGSRLEDLEIGDNVFVLTEENINDVQVFIADDK